MIKLDKPSIDLQTILDNCTSNMLEPRKSRIEQVKPTLLDKSKEYDLLAGQGELYTIPEHISVDSLTTKEDMEVLYTQKFVPESQANREYYDKIKLLAPHKKCPYCGQNIVTTVDHFLPKSKYVSYTVTPCNLVPSCSDCNKLKSASAFHTYSEQPLHPYYDDFDDMVWLKARLIEEEPVSFRFYVDPPAEWERLRQERMMNNFDSLALKDIYKVHAAELYYVCSNRIKILFQKGGRPLAVERLKEYIEDERCLRNNSWKAAVYQAIIESNWYWEVYL